MWRALFPCLLLTGLASLLSGCGDPAVSADGTLYYRLDSLLLPASGKDTALSLARSEMGGNWADCYGCDSGYSGGFVPWFLARNRRTLWNGNLEFDLRIDSLFPLAADPQRGLVLATLQSPRNIQLIGEIRTSLPMDRILPMDTPFFDTLTFRDSSGLFLRMLDSSVITYRGAYRQETMMVF